VTTGEGTEEKATTAAGRTGSGDGGARGELRVAARRGSAFTLGGFFNGFLQFAFLALITHTIAQRDVGALLEAIAIFTIGSNVAELGADSGLLRMMPIFHRRRPQDLRRLANVSVGPALVASCIVAVLVYIFAPQLSDVFVHHASKPETSDDLRIIALFLPISTVATVISAGLRTWSARIPVVLNNFLVPFARPVLFTMFLIVGVNAKLALIAWGVPTIAVLVLAALALDRHIRETLVDTAVAGVEPAPYGAVALEFWRFSLPRTFGAMFQVFITYIDILLVGAYRTAGSAASYSVASRYVTFSTFALGAVVSAVATQLSRLMDGRDYDKVNAVYKSATWWTAAASWPPLLVLAVFSPLFMTIFGHGYRSGAGALTILSLAMLVTIGTGPNGLLLLMSGRSGLNLAIQGLGLAVNVGLNVWLIPILGLPGAAIAWAATILVTCFCASFILWKSFRIQPFGRGYLAVVLAAGGCFGALGLIARAAFGTGVVTFVVFAIVSCSLYAGALFKARRVLNLDAFGAAFSRKGFIGSLAARASARS
jgi:O-antigen/teichoic acid export membrane protein